MAESSDKEDADHHCEILQDCLLETLSAFRDKTNSGNEEILREGSAVVSMMETVRDGLGKVDVRSADGKNVIESISTFIEKAKKYDYSLNDSKCKGYLQMMSKTVKQFGMKLGGNWNVGLPSSSSIKTVQSSTSFHPSSISSNQSSSVHNAQPVSSKSRAGPEPTSKSEDGDWEFIKIEVPSQSYQCPDCDAKPFTNAQSFTRHAKKTHNKVRKPEKPKITCLLPHEKTGTRVISQHSWEGMRYHLSGVHKIEKPSKDHKLRGFIRYKGVTSVVFLKDNEEDPQPPAVTLDHHVQPREEQHEEPRHHGEEHQDVHVQPEAFPVPVQDNSQMGIDVAGTEVQLTIDPGQKNKVDEVDNSEIRSQNELNKSNEAVANFDLECSLIDNSPKDATTVTVESENDKVEAGKDSSNVEAEHPNDDADIEKHPVEKEKEGNVIEAEKEKDVNRIEAEKEKEGNRMEVDQEKSDANIDYDAMYVEDLFYSSNPENLAAEVFKDDSHLIIEEDSGVDDDDSEEFTKERLNHQILRYRQRKDFNMMTNLHEKEGNKVFVEECTQYVVEKSVSEDPEVSTVTFLTSLLFRHPDSLLHWEYSQDKSFSLDRLVDFNGERFLELRDPMEWINHISGSDRKQKPTRRKQMLKCHKQLRDFIKKKLRETVFGNDLESMVRRDKIRTHLDDMTAAINDSNIWGKLQKQIDHTKKLVDGAKEIVNPSNKSTRVCDLNKTYFASKQFKKRSDTHKKVWKEAMDSGTVSPKDFNNFANFSRHLLFYYDRCREGVYQKITVNDFINRREIWFPPGYNSLEFEGMPSEKGFNMYEKQQRSPDAYTILVPGSRSGLKNSQDAHITVFDVVDEWLRKYQDLVKILIGDRDLDSYFFVSYQPSRKKTAPLTHMTNSRGSLLYEYGQVTGDTNITSNTFRRELETKVQSTHKMSTRSKVVTQHSTAVGDTFYEKTQSEYRASAMQYFNLREGTLAAHEDDDELPESVQAKRAKYEESDKEKSLQKAKEIIKNHQVPRNLTVGKNCKIMPVDRIYLQETFGAAGKLSSLNLHVGKFPDEAAFKHSFYRLVDGGHSLLTDQDVEKFREIERSVFGGIREKALAEFGGEWVNSLEQNKFADQMVTNAIRTSFQYSEKNKKDDVPGFFKF